MVDTQSTVCEVAVRYPQTLAVFERHEIDYCCGGGDLLAVENNVLFPRAVEMTRCHGAV